MLLALSLVASVLVVAPAAAADPKADFPAAFDACMGSPAADFTDVPEGHANAGDIDCIAYYNITKGTGDGSTYSPLMAVTREQMALFLMRLADRVGIEVVANPSDPGFTDTGDLTAESQTAIAQLADLGITKGTGDGTTYSPEANVKRGHMALFIQRLMNNMSPIADGSAKYGHLPSDVAKNTKKHMIGSPFTDLGPATKDEYDAITQLWELNVASGISDTSYGPGSDITRAAMAGFMAGLLDHSNARPAGLSIEANKTSGHGELTSVVLVSYRSDAFDPMEAQSVDIFSSVQANKGLNDNGTCDIDGTNGPVECTQDSSDETTDAMGNIFVDSTTADGKTRVWYAWTGKRGDKFDADTVDEVTATIVSSPAQTQLKVTSTKNANANANNVDLDVTESVTFTIQLQDGEHKNVARSGVDISIRVVETGGRAFTNSYTMKTDDDGKVMFTVTAPADTDATNDRTDLVTITSAGITPDADDTQTVAWVETDSVLTTAKIAASFPYAVRNSQGEVSVGAVVTLYDQYGNLQLTPKQTVTIGIDGTDSNPARSGSTGKARWSRSNLSKNAGDTVALTATIIDVADTAHNEAGVSVTAGSIVVYNAAADDTFVTTAADVTLHHKQSKFAINNNLYGYDADDEFIQSIAGNTKSLTLEEFEAALGKDITVGTVAQVIVPRYDDDGSSTFVVTRRAIR